MDKASISKNYLETQKQFHLDGSYLSEYRRALVIGVDPSNIGASVVARLEADGFDVMSHNKSSMDLNDRDRVEDVHWEAYDTVVFCNGHTRLDWFEDIPDKEIVQVLNDSLLASIRGAQTFVRRTIGDMRRKHIVFIGSMAYRSVLNGSAVYCAAKAGLAHFARCLAWELAPKGYDVFCVHPSNTEGTPMTEETIAGLMRYRNLNREDAESYWGAILPKKNWLQPTDIAELISFLVSGKAEYLSGANLDLAGGQR
jgi:NAD(P)-dependent dehydrogenase (short-subunit alcohol dehydrogenase family)